MKVFIRVIAFSFLVLMQVGVGYADLYSNGTLIPGLSITLDGSISDWTSSCLITRDGDEDGAIAYPFNLKDLYMANDDAYLYLAFTRYEPIGLPDNGNSYLYLVIDGDNNSSSGSYYDGPAYFDMPGASLVARFHMTINNKLDLLNAADGSGGWVSLLGGSYGFAYSASSEAVEVRIPLSEIADCMIGGTISLKAGQSYRGDTIIGWHWNVEVYPVIYSVVPEPASLSLLLMVLVGWSSIKRIK